MQIIKLMLLVINILLVTSCVVLNGNYLVKVYDESGNEMTKIIWHAQGRGVYTTKIAACKVYPGASLKVINMDTGDEVKSESKKCPK